MLDLEKAFTETFQVPTDILKSPVEVSSATEWTDVAVKLPFKVFYSNGDKKIAGRHFLTH